MRNHRSYVGNSTSVHTTSIGSFDFNKIIQKLYIQYSSILIRHSHTPYSHVIHTFQQDTHKVFECHSILHISTQEQYSCSQTCSQANLINVSFIMSIKKNLVTLLNMSLTHSACKVCAKCSHFDQEMIPTWCIYYNMCYWACINQPCEGKIIALFYLCSVITLLLTVRHQNTYY